MRPAVKQVKRSCGFQEINPVLYLLSATFLSSNTQTMLVQWIVPSDPVYWQLLPLPSKTTVDEIVLVNNFP